MNIDSLRTAIIDSMQQVFNQESFNNALELTNRVENWYSNKFYMLLTIVGIVFVIVTIIPQIVEWFKQKSFIKEMNKKFENKLKKILDEAYVNVDNKQKAFDKNIDEKIEASKEEISKKINDSLVLVYLDHFDIISDPLNLMPAIHRLYNALILNNRGTMINTDIIIEFYKQLLDWLEKIEITNRPGLVDITKIIDISHELNKNKQHFKIEHQDALDRLNKDKEQFFFKLTLHHEKSQ